MDKKRWLMVMVGTLIVLGVPSLALSNNYNKVAFLARNALKFFENVNFNGYNITNVGAICLIDGCHDSWANISAVSNDSLRLGGRLPNFYLNVSGPVNDSANLGGLPSSFYVNQTRAIFTTFPLGGGGTLGSDRTLTFDNTSLSNLDAREAANNLTQAVQFDTKLNLTSQANDSRALGSQPSNFFYNTTNITLSAGTLGTQASNFFQNGTESITTSLPAENITSGTLDDRRLSINVTFLNRNQTIIGDTNFTGSVRINSLLSGTNITGAVPNSNQLGGQNSNFYQNATPPQPTTSLPAENITSGTLDDRRLSSNVSFLNKNQTFIGDNNFTGVVRINSLLSGTNITGAVPNSNQLGGQASNFFQNGTESVTTSLPASNITGGTFPQFYTFANVSVHTGINISDILNGNRTFLGFPNGRSNWNATNGYKLMVNGDTNITGIVNATTYFGNLLGTFAGQSTNFFQNGTESITTSLPADNITSGTFSGFYNITNIIRAILFTNNVNVTDVLNATRIFGNLLGTFGGQSTNFFQNGTEIITTSLPASNITGGTFPQFYQFANETVHKGVNVTDVLIANRSFFGFATMSLNNSLNNTANYKLYVFGNANISGIINATTVISNLQGTFGTLASNQYINNTQNFAALVNESGISRTSISRLTANQIGWTIPLNGTLYDDFEITVVLNNTLGSGTTPRSEGIINLTLNSDSQINYAVNRITAATSVNMVSQRGVQLETNAGGLNRTLYMRISKLNLVGTARLWTGEWRMVGMSSTVATAPVLSIGGFQWSNSSNAELVNFTIQAMNVTTGTTLNFTAGSYVIVTAQRR